MALGSKRQRAALDLAERLWLIKANPYCGGYVMVEAAEPGVSLFIGGAGFAADVIPSQGLSASAGASSDYVPHHGMQDVYRAFIGQTPGNANFFTPASLASP